MSDNRGSKSEERRAMSVEGGSRMEERGSKSETRNLERSSFPPLFLWLLYSSLRRQ